MSYQVVYFTRTGHSKRVAGKIAQGLNTSLIEIDDHKNWKGLIGYIRAGFYSTVDKKVNITLSEPLDETKNIILVTPLWAGGIAPAARAFLYSQERNQVHLVVTSIGSTVKDREGFLSVIDIVKRDQNEDQVIERFIKTLKAQKNV